MRDDQSLEESPLLKVPSELRDLTWLTWLDLSFNKLQELPDWVSNLSELGLLSLSGNLLSTLPNSLSQLKELYCLEIGNNLFRDIPPVIFELTSLVRLGINNAYDLSEETQIANNLITEIPERLLYQDKLAEFYFEEESITEPPPEVVAEGFEEMRAYYRRLNEEGIALSYEAKLLILGEGGAGKTTLRKKIVDAGYLVDPAEKSTDGIDVIRWKFEQDGKEFRVNIWDFGGQEVYHATHQFFLSARSLYVLVADQRKEDTDYHYWLNVAKTLGQNSPVLIVKNEKQGLKPQLNLSQFRDDFNLRGPEELDLATRDQRAVQRLIDEIKRELLRLPHVGNKIPPKWKTVRDALETIPGETISREQFYALCDEKGIAKREDKVALSDWLHNLGVCLHFQKDEVLKHLVILKPEWATGGVYRVLRDGAVIERLGRFDKSDLQRVLTEPSYEDKHDEVLQLMKQFKLCYPIANGSYIAPKLLPNEPPAYDWVTADDLLVQYDYGDFMPKGIVTTFIVDMHERIARQDDSALVWKNGVIIESIEKGAQAQVIEFFGPRKIEVRVAGANRRALWEVVQDKLDEINLSYGQGRLKVEKLTPCNCDECEKRLHRERHLWKYSELKSHLLRRRRTVPCPIGSEADVVRLVDDVFLVSDLFTGDIEDLRQKLRAALINKFSGSELEELCFSMGIDAEQIASAKADKRELARKLIEHCQRRDALERLRDAIVTARPNLAR